MKLVKSDFDPFFLPSLPAVYRIIGSRGAYIGGTQDLKARISCHRSNLCAGIHSCKPLLRDFRKGHRFRIVYMLCGMGRINKLEHKWFNSHRRKYNLRNPGRLMRVGIGGPFR